mmetsp:Transcript_4997/g.12943  ORF Transcript_4997/g.12943 Transcript_4997/m.12943 type:complete len:373 (-) Transcript_4997:1940-3058(-)
MATKIVTTIVTTRHDDGTVTQTTTTKTEVVNPVAAPPAAAGPTITLSTGQKMPLMGLGTWQAKKGEVGAAVKTALELGYRHVDCAACYGNETEVGTALTSVFAAGKIAREDVFITSKLWNSEHHPDHVRLACETTLKELQLNYLDLYIIHWPHAFVHVDGSNRSFPRDDEGNMRYDMETTLLQTWTAMEALVDAGLVKAIGLSNFNVDQVDEIVTKGRIMPVCNQVECHPYFQQDTLIKACADRNVQVTAYSPLGTGAAAADGVKIFEHPVLTEIGAKYGASAAQVAIAFQVARKIPTFPKSVQAVRLAENLQSVDIALTVDDLAEIAKLETGKRGPNGWAGKLVERNGRKEPRDLHHVNFPFKADVPVEGL